MSKKKTIIIIMIMILLQSVIYIACGIKKSYIHMDEAYSLGLASYHRTEIQDNEDFYNNWHPKEYYEDYIALNEEEKDNFKPVYENQKNDVHPPFYYLLLRFAMSFSVGHFTKWPGIILNIIIYSLISIFTYLILKRFFKKEENSTEKAIALTFFSSITLASLTNVIYIRMYAITTLMVIITTFLHIKLSDNKNNKKIMALIGMTALIGSLTHYYYLFFIFMMYLIYLIKYIKEKNYKGLSWYTGFLGIAAITSLIIFPYSLDHMFFGYRGEGFISNLFNIPSLVINLGGYLFLSQQYIFHYTLIPLVIIIVGLLINKKIQKNKNNIFSTEEKDLLTTIGFPTVFYFLIAGMASPFITLRYILPVSIFIFTLICYCFYKLLKTITSEKRSLIILGIIMLITFLIPVFTKLEPEEIYTNKAIVVEKISELKDSQAIYFFNTADNRFLDDILLFSIIENSYIAKDMEVTEDRVKAIVEDKDLSNGLIIFINSWQENDKIMKTVKEVTHLENDEYLVRLNNSDVYFLN